MLCPQCHKTIDDTAVAKLEIGDALRALLKDWRLWAMSVAISLASQFLLSGLAGLPSFVGAGVGGGFIGLLWVTRAKALHRCPHCQSNYGA